ncbi:MAG: VirB4 family type IV secretion system protein, partial [Actinomycetota bacterium]
VECFPRRLRVGETYAETLHVEGYPREVEPGWLEPLLSYRGLVDLAFHIHPIENGLAAKLLQVQRARMESERSQSEVLGQLVDEKVVACAEDADELSRALARGEQRLFRQGFYFTVRAATEGALQAEGKRAATLARSLLLEPRPATFRPLRAWYSTLPLALDLLKRTRILPTRPLAFTFPFGTGEVLGHPTGVLYGINLATGSPVVVDRFALNNYSQVTIGESGSGKSYAAKLGVLQSLERGVEVAVIDPEDEFVRLAQAVGGTVVRLGGRDGCGGIHRINPFDLAAPCTPDGLEQQRFFLRTLLDMLLGGPDPGERERLDAALNHVYRQAGITEDPGTHARPAPTLEALGRSLAEGGAEHIAHRLAPWTSGSYRSLFSGPTTVRPDGHLVVFALGHLPQEPQELKAAAMVAAANALWRRIAHADRPREVVVDEAWQFMPLPGVARFFQSLAKRSRKRWCGLTFITQDLEDIAEGPERAVLTNSAIKLLFRQSPQAIGAVSEAFGLTKGERRFLTGCRRGEGLLTFGDQRARISVVASDEEHDLITTNPAEVKRLARG